jgi:hypothetical protein
MAKEPDIEWLERDFPCDDEPGNRKVFGIIQEATVSDPGISACFVIKCSDGTVVQDEFVYSLDPCEAVGGLVKLELTPDNRVGARRFKAIDDMLLQHRATLAAEERRRRDREKRNNTHATQNPLKDSPLMLGSNTFATLASRSPWGGQNGRVTFTIPHECEKGTINLRMRLDYSGGTLAPIDYSTFQGVTTKIEIQIIPTEGYGANLSVKVNAAEAVRLLGGVRPSAETFDNIYRAVLARKGQPPPAG